MRQFFFDSLYKLMSKDKNIIFITADMGYFFAGSIKKEFPDRFFNTGAAEMTAMCMAVGLALSGKIPIVYTITPFLLFRPFEVIRNYVDHESIPVIMVGTGRDDDYKDAGFSHYAGDHDIIKQFKNIEFVIEYSDLKTIIYSGKPTYLNLKR